MTELAARRQSHPARRRAVGGTGLGLALAVAGVATGTTSAHAAEVVVEPGDTVGHIAQRTGTSVPAIVRANGLDSRATIRVGQRLVIPSADAATPVTAPAAAPAARTHAVVAGDTVWELAKRYGTTVDALVSANGLDSRARIRVGQVLTLPGAAGASAAAGSGRTAATTTTTSSGSHTVRSGDTVSALAARYGTTVRAIVEANGLDSRALIRVGQTLAIPGAGTTGAPAPAKATATTTTVTHTVRSGETVSALATRYGTTVQAIVQANGLDRRAFIREGQRLSIPSATGAAATTSSGTQLVGSTFAGRTYPAATVASANANKATLLAVGVPSKAEMQRLVRDTAVAMGVDPALALAIAYQESGFDQSAVSPANAIGTMQVIPSSGAWASELVGRDLNLLDPHDNVTAGVAILRQLVKSAPDLPTAIAGYYQGLAGVRAHGMYPDTRRYVANVQTLMSRFA